MKRIIYILLIFVAIPFVVFSQKDTANSKWSICAGGGVGFPKGAFNLSRFAYTGSTGYIYATERLKKSIYDIVFLVRYNSNGFDLNGYLNDPNRNGAGGYGGEAISNGVFQEVSALAGLSISMPKNSKSASLNIRFLLGVVYSYYPHMEYYTYDPNLSTTDHVYINPTSSFLYNIPFDIGVNFKIPVYKKVFISAEIDYMNTGASWKTTEQITNSSGITTQPYTDKSSLDLLNITGGIGYRF